MNRKKIGILGGGQLGMFICQIAKKMNIQTSVFSEIDDFSAKKFCDNFFIANYNNQKTLNEFLNSSDIFTIETENIPKNVLWNIEKKNDDGELKNIFLKEKIKENEYQIIFAKKGIINNKNNKSSLLLFDGTIMNNSNDKTNSFEFSETEMNLSKFSTNTTTHPKIQEITTYDVIACIVKLKNFQSSFIINKFKTKKTLINCRMNNIKISFQETFKRIILPFYLPVLTLIASLIIIKSKDDYEFFKYKLVLFVFGVMTIIISEISMRYSSSNILENIYLVSLPILLFFFIYIYFKIKLRKPVMIN